MAKDAVDEAVKQLPGAVGKSITDKVPLIGADGYQALANNQGNRRPRSAWTARG